MKNPALSPQIPITGAFPPGHFYSPIPDLAYLKANETKLFPTTPSPKISGINFYSARQLKLLQKLAKYSLNQPFTDDHVKTLRYHFANPAFGHGDGLILHAMIRYLKPKNIVEIGSGYSSAAILDTNEIFFHNKIKCNFIEPYPQLLYSLMKVDDKKRNKVIAEPLQSVKTKLFSQLKANDILFIDSTHVSKVGSDVNKIFFEILPNLNKGVYIHLHDIFFPFEYPKDWIYQGFYWNENYMLRAFLTNNPNFEICFFNNYLFTFHLNQIKKYLPLMLSNSGGSIWLKKVK